MKKSLFLSLIFLISQNIFSQVKPEYNSKLDELFGESVGCFVIYDKNNNKYIRYHEVICNTRYSPMSTFKVPNSLIALETGVLQNEESLIHWDSIRDPKKDWWKNVKWNQDHTLQTAFENSVVWYYQEIARHVGKEKYIDLLNILEYGNQETGEEIDIFWLDGSIQISANEQIEFLKKFYFNQYGFADQSINTVKKIFIREQNPNYILSYKTGTGDISENEFIAWLIGYVERDDNVYFFAMNILGDDFRTTGNKRIEISLNFLRYLNLIE